MSLRYRLTAFILVGIVSPLVVMFFITDVVYRECLTFVLLTSTGCLLGSEGREFGLFIGRSIRSFTVTPVIATAGGLSQNALGKLKRKRYCSAETTGSNGDAAPDNNTTWNDTSIECRICLSEFEDGETVLTLRCGHIYHELCATTWLRLHNRCPVCNEPIVETAALVETEMVAIGIGNDEIGSPHN